MPEFSVEQWTSFKEQFLSVIRFIMYSFDMFIDTCRSNPMLYMFLFFPIFAAAFFVVFELVSKISGSFSGNVSFGPSISSNALKGAASQHTKMAAINLAAFDKAVNLKSSNAAKLEGKQMKAFDKASGHSSGKGTGMTSNDMKVSKSGKASGMSSNDMKIHDYGDTGLSISHGVRGIIKNSKKRKNTAVQTDIIHKDDGNGNLVTVTEKRNKKGKVISHYETVHHRITEKEHNKSDE